MTSATVIDTRVQRRQMLPQPVGLPRIKTFVGQAIAGSVLAHFLVFSVPFLLIHSENLAFWLFAFSFFLFLSLLAGAMVGPIIWACTKSDDRPLRALYRFFIALVVLVPGWLYFSRLAFSSTISLQLWLVAWLLVPAGTIGMFTHSRLRLGNELVRGGEAAGRLSRVLAAVLGALLRLTVILLFMESLVGLIWFVNHPQPNNAELIWTTLVCGHFAASVVVLFARTHIGLLTVISAITLVPLVLAFVLFPEITGPLRYVVIGYLGLWAMFLLTRWRQMDVALAFLNDEIHYYLID